MPRRREDETESLIIDRSAAAEIPALAAVREWARDKRAFISSVMTDLKTERRAAASAIRKVGAQPVMFETFGGRDSDPEDAYFSEVETSDIYVGILGRRYGKQLPSRFSATHAEYLHAEKTGLRIAMWAMALADREGHQQSFLDEVRTFHVVPESTSADDLTEQIQERLKKIAAEDLAPWCKLGSIIFRASEVSDRGSDISVLARVRSDSVAQSLETMREGLGRGAQARFTWTGRSRYVRVNAIESRTTAARSRSVRLTLQVVDGPSDRNLEITVSGFTPDDLTEMALRTVLFRTKNPLTDRPLGSFAEMEDPFHSLREARVADEILRPLAELLIIDALVGSGRADRVTEFSLGSRIGDERNLRLSWQPPARYSRETARTRAITGKVRL